MEETAKKTTKTKREPKVELFGEDIGSHADNGFHKEQDSYFDKEAFREKFHHNHRHHGSLTWGLAFILIGLLFLLSNFGALPPVIWSQVARLWPLLIIFIGFDTLLGHSEIADLVNSLVALFIFATILGVVFLNYSPNLLHGLPQNVLNYLYSINSYLHIR